MQKYAESRSSTDKNGQLGSSVPSLIRGLSQFLDDASWSVASPCQRQIVRRLEGSERDVHFAQSKLQFRLMHSKGLQLGFSYERTGWRRRADKEADGEDGEATPEAKQMHTPPELPYAPEYTVTRRMLIVLGTGSAAPSKLRASSGMYLELSGSGAAEVASMLVDCGEGTYGQLWRQFGREVTQRIGGLRCIWISHNHADHHCGLVRVLYEYWRFHTHHSDGKTPPPLIVVGPQSVLSYVKSWLPEFGGKMPTSQLFQLATCSEFNRSDHPLRRQLLSDIGFAVTSIISVPVFHCYDSYGLVLTLQGGKKLVYSGDTKPCNQLVVAGMNAALLVHEATFDDTMEQDARLKKHSTVGQAMDIARRMKAQQLVLTHFSQRYPALPPPVTTSSSSDGITTGANPSGREMKVLCAFDGFVHPMPF
ncbi:hypothetical protein BBJ28_00013369 [Nothophytophthora sp. Chile5]|nr:hypothetical protein BBJ28_00013369 [Nothophytophthora sp. Chile5]